MAVTLQIPMLAGSRLRAHQIFADLPNDISDEEVRLRCGSLVAATASFADETVLELLVRRGAARIIVMDLDDPEFAAYLSDCALTHGLPERLFFACSNFRAPHSGDYPTYP